MRTTRLAIGFLGFVVSFAAAAAWPVPSGTFSGRGEWKGQGASGEYTVETSVNGDVIKSSYSFREGEKTRAESHSYKVSVKEEPFFDLLNAEGKSIGSGYCYDDDCSYRAELPGGIVVQETLRFSKGSLEKIGTKRGPGFEVAWKENLEAK